jgi:GntR family histidine utilization transcriptional repressor
MMSEAAPLPHYQRIKRAILASIESGELAVGDRVPSEQTLVKRPGVSRMTVNRALRELTDERVLVRAEGMGRFVAERDPPSDLMQLRDIATEIRERGQRHSARVVRLETREAEEEEARLLRLEPGGALVHSVIVHLADGTPLQLEDRLVNPAIVPDYARQDFEATTPTDYLLRVVPHSAVEHVIEAVMPDAREREALEMAVGEPCLQLRRRTLKGEQVVTAVRILYPGRAYRFGTRFSFDAGGKPRWSYL